MCVWVSFFFLLYDGALLTQRINAARSQSWGSQSVWMRERARARARLSTNAGAFALLHSRDLCLALTHTNRQICECKPVSYRSAPNWKQNSFMHANCPISAIRAKHLYTNRWMYVWSVVVKWNYALATEYKLFRLFDDKRTHQSMQSYLHTLLIRCEN